MTSFPQEDLNREPKEPDTPLLSLGDLVLPLTGPGASGGGDPSETQSMHKKYRNQGFSSWDCPRLASSDHTKQVLCPQPGLP